MSATEEAGASPRPTLPGPAGGGPPEGLKRDATLAIATGFAIQAVLVVTGVLLARMLGPDGRGYLAALILWPLVITQLGNLGIPSALTYSIARDPSASRAIARLGPVLRDSAGAPPDRVPGPLAAVDPAWGSRRGPHGRMADARACPRDARSPIRPRTASGPAQAAALQRIASLALAAVRAWRRRALCPGRGRDRAGHRRALGRILEQRQRRCHQRPAILAGRGRSFRRPAVSRLLRAARPSVQHLGGRRASPRSSGAGAVPRARGLGPIRRRPGVYEPAVLHRQERRLDHLPLGRLASQQRPMRAGRCGPSSG